MTIFLGSHRKMRNSIDSAKSSGSETKKVEDLSLKQVRLIAMHLYCILVTKQQILYQT